MSKYGAKKTVVDGITFDSKREAADYSDLRLREKAGEICELELQPKYPLYVCGRKNGELVEVCIYKPDFRYREGPQKILVVQDSKGFQTPVYRLKKKMFELQYGIQIRET